MRGQPMSDDQLTENRVTLAVLKNDIDHLTRLLERMRVEGATQREEMRAEGKTERERIYRDVCMKLDDHEGRLRGLESSSRNAVYRDGATFITAVAAGVVAALTGK